MSEIRDAIRLRLRQTADDFRQCTPKSCCLSFKDWILRNLLLVLLLTFMIGGIITGTVMKSQGVVFTQRQLKYFGFPGEILMRLLKMIIIPLIVSSLMAGLANLDLKSSGKIGLRACTYYVATTICAVVLGIVLCQIIRPGERVDGAAAKLTPSSKVTQISSVDAMMDLVRNVFPDNLIEACFRLTVTKYKEDPCKNPPCNASSRSNIQPPPFPSSSSSSSSSSPSTSSAAVSAAATAVLSPPPAKSLTKRPSSPTSKRPPGIPKARIPTTTPDLLVRLRRSWQQQPVQLSTLSPSSSSSSPHRPISSPLLVKTRTIGKDILVIQHNNTNATNSSSYNITVSSENYDREIKIETTDGMNIMGLVTFSVAFGMIISSRKSECRALIEFVTAVELVTMRLVMIIMWYSPIGVFFLVAAKIVEMESVSVIFTFLAYYSITVLSGLFIHGLILLPTIYFLITRKNPLSYISGIMPALITAIGTSSSSATLPMTFRCLEETNGIDKRVTRFVLPIGATINMDGTALYEAVAPIFIAQVRRIELTFVQIIAISITATFASIGAAGIPQAGLVTMVMVLSAVGLEPQDVTLIIAVDWFLDRFRTMINVLGDSIGAGIVQHLSRAELEALPMHVDGDDAAHQHHHNQQQHHDMIEKKLLQANADLEHGNAHYAGDEDRTVMKPLIIAKKVNDDNTAVSAL